MKSTALKKLAILIINPWVHYNGHFYISNNRTLNWMVNMFEFDNIRYIFL